MPAQRKNALLDRLVTRIENHQALVGIIGLGYVGLPLARTFTDVGIKVRGFDIDPAKIKALNAGRSYLKHIPAATIRRMRKNDLFTATDDFSKLKQVDAIIICVPTPLTKSREPDLSYVSNTCRTIAEYLRAGQLIVLESTTYPGTTREVLWPILARSGLKLGKDIFVAFSPEREDPGRTNYTTATIPKVVGGADPASLRVATALYAQALTQVVPVDSCEIAEASKLLENIYRCVNIAMVNEMKVLFDRMGIDIWKVIAASSTKPFGFQPFYPGPGLGGHCIPIDPFYLSWKARQYDTPTRFIELAGEINTDMPRYVLHRVSEALNTRKKSLKGSRILVLGLAYKPDVDDLRESPSIIIIELLREAGVRVDYNDPYIPTTHRQREHDLGMTSKKLSPRMLAGYDGVLICTNHSCYDYKWIVKNSKLVVDTRNACAKVRTGRGKIEKA